MDKFWWLTLGLLIGWVIHWILTSFFCKCKCNCDCHKGNKTTTGEFAVGNERVERTVNTTVNTPSSATHLKETVVHTAAAIVPSGLFQVGGKDDLKVIEGIGPKVAEVLHAAGITQFHELAVTPVAKLNELLHADGLQMLNPGTWPEQAALIAKGDKAAFERLTEELKGGVRV